MKFITVKFITLFVILLLSSTVLKAAEWRGITPLKSTRADVERLLGKPNDYLGRYLFDNERASIHYKSVPCDRTDRCDCFVPTDTVLGIWIDVEEEMKFSQLNIDRMKFEKKINSDDNTTYANWEMGIIYHVNQQDNRVWNIDYIESEKDCKEVLKSNVKNAAR
jgi:hypothetical protein